MRYSSHTSYLTMDEAHERAPASLGSYVTVVQPKLLLGPTGFVSLTIPTGVLVLFGLLMSFFLAGTRFLTHLFTEERVRGFRPHKDAKSVLIVGAGEGGRLLLREVQR